MPNKKRLRTYFFDLGNTAVGAVGCCAYVKGVNKADAIERLTERLGRDNHDLSRLDDKIEGIHVYFNLENLKPGDVRLSRS